MAACSSLTDAETCARGGLHCCFHNLGSIIYAGRTSVTHSRYYIPLRTQAFAGANPGVILQVDPKNGNHPIHIGAQARLSSAPEAYNRVAEFYLHLLKKSWHLC